MHDPEAALLGIYCQRGVHHCFDCLYRLQWALLIGILHCSLLFIIIGIIHLSLLLPDLCCFHHLQKCRIQYS